MQATTTVWYSCDVVGTDRPITLTREQPIHGPLTTVVEACAELRARMFMSLEGRSFGSSTSDDFTRLVLSSKLTGPLSQRVRKELRYNYPEAL